MKKVADLHIHTHYSDGIYSPEKIIQMAADKGLSAISITDHDTIAGLQEAHELSKKYDVEIINGVELSCYENGREYHILGYGFDLNDQSLVDHLDMYKTLRRKRAEIMHQKLEQLGVKFSFRLIEILAGDAPITRPHIAASIHKAGYVNSAKEAFDQYIGNHGPAYHPKANFSVANAIDMLNRSGGIAVLAHPAYSVEHNELYKIIEQGLDGIEVIHPAHNEDLTRFYHSIANQYWLIETGGSDFHGIKDYDEGNFGMFVVPYASVESIKYHQLNFK